jgi:hypothetical protein
MGNTSLFPVPLSVVGLQYPKSNVSSCDAAVFSSPPVALPDDNNNIKNQIPH